MKITALEPVRVAIPFTHDGPQTGFAGQTWSKLEYLLVRVDTDEGLTGWGEAFGYGCIPATQAALVAQVAPLAIGRRADDIGALMDSLKQTLHVFGRSGPVQFALAGLDIALWDLAGKRAGLPLHRLLGGGGRATVPAYASKLRLGKPRHVAGACEKAVRRGFRGIKLHEIAVDTVAAARDAVGDDVALMLDVNCPWSPAEALAIGRQLQPFHLAWFEEPVWPPENLQAFTELHRALGMPLAAGENCSNAWSFKSLAATEGLDILQPSITKVGGVSEFQQVATLAKLHGRQLVPHSPYFGPGFLATLQMAAVHPDMPWLEYLSVDLERPLFGDVGRVEPDGTIAIPTSAGMGADPDPETLSRYRVG
jgi:L-alanine-DL-glutamate epimerase-like enolase superfamily enzyme